MSDSYGNVDQTDPGLLRRIKDRGNKAAWSEFDVLYRPMLLRFARSRGLPSEDAEDIVQHCMASVCAHIEQFSYDPTRGRFKSWLRTMVNNRCRDLLRIHRHCTVILTEADQLPAADPSPDEAFDKIWLDEHVNHCLRIIRQEVDEATFAAFERYVLRDQPVEQVCRELALMPDQLYKIKWRLTKRLREALRELLGDDSDWAT